MPPSGRCSHQNSPDRSPTSETSAAFCFCDFALPPSDVNMFDSNQASPTPGNRPGCAAQALWDMQLVGNILDPTKGLSRWDSDTNRAPLCKKPRGESLKDAGTGWTEQTPCSG